MEESEQRVQLSLCMRPRETLLLRKKCHSLLTNHCVVQQGIGIQKAGRRPTALCASVTVNSKLEPPWRHKAQNPAACGGAWMPAEKSVNYLPFSKGCRFLQQRWNMCEMLNLFTEWVVVICQGHKDRSLLAVRAEGWKTTPIIGFAIDWLDCSVEQVA